MEKQGLNELAAVVHENAVAHGWWEQERELPEILMLCVSELAEALEEYRAGKPNIYYNVEGEEILYADGEACEKVSSRAPVWGASSIPSIIKPAFKFQVVPPCGGHLIHHARNHAAQGTIKAAIRYVCL